jgi:hypothetical protein
MNDTDSALVSRFSSVMNQTGALIAVKGSANSSEMTVLFRMENGEIWERAVVPLLLSLLSKYEIKNHICQTWRLTPRDAGDTSTTVVRPISMTLQSDDLETSVERLCSEMLRIMHAVTKRDEESAVTAPMDFALPNAGIQQPTRLVPMQRTWLSKGLKSNGAGAIPLTAEKEVS